MGIYHDSDDGIPGDLAPKGEPEKLNQEGMGKPKCEPEVEAALAEFAPVQKAQGYSSLAADAQKASIPNEGGDSVYNVGELYGKAGGGKSRRDE